LSPHDTGTRNRAWLFFVEGTCLSQYLLRRLLLGIFFTRFASETPDDSSMGMKGAFLMMELRRPSALVCPKRIAVYEESL
jgi:hypothetical protein